MKYAPDIRFFRYKSKENNTEVLEELKKIMPDIVKDELAERAQQEGVEPKIHKREFKKIVEENYDRVYRHMLSQSDFASVIFEKKKEKKFDENGKRIRNNRDEHGKKKKYPKNKPKSGFWGEKRG